MLDLSEDELIEVKLILVEVLPAETEVLAFGSRVRDNARKYSDLDLLICGERPLSLAEIERIKFAFSESNLPFKTDIVDRHQINDEFRQEIERDAVLLT